MSEFTDFLSNLFGGTKKKPDDYYAAREELGKYVENQTTGPLPKPEKLPETPKYDRLEYDSASDEELGSRAENELKDYYGSGKNAIESEIDALGKKYEAEKIAADKAAKDKTEAIYGAYGAAKESTDNDVLRRGLARSSIAALRRSELDEAAAKETAAVARELYDTALKIDKEIEGLGVKREKALNDFDIAYASKLAERIGELITERDKKAAEALKYNNSLTEKEHKAEIDRISKESDLYTKALSQKKAENELKDAAGYGEYGETYAKMRDVLAMLDPVDARKAFVNDPIYRENLNDFYYYKLYNEFARR